MNRKRVGTVALALAVAAGLLVGWRVARAMLPACGRHNPAGGSAARLLLPRTERDLGTVPQGTVVRTAFPITNAGNRRLVLFEEQEGCCGQSLDPRQLVVPAGNTEQLVVRIDTAQRLGRMEHTVRYTTNDPGLPRLSLKVTGTVQ